MNQKLICASLLALSSSVHLPQAYASGTIVWACTSPDISSQYLPSGCSSIADSSPTPAPTPTPTPAPTPIKTSPSPSPSGCVGIPMPGGMIGPCM